MNNPRVVFGLASLWVVGMIVAIIVAFLIFAENNRPTAPFVPSQGTTTPAAAAGLTSDQLRTIGLNVLPPVTMPPDNPLTVEKAELGKLLFFDRRMSGNGLVSCATCHDPNKGWGDGNEVSLGYPGTLHWRNSQTIINTAYLQKLFWGGEKTSLEAQAKSAFTGNLAGNLDTAMAEERLRQIPEYVRRFKEVFGNDEPTFDDMLRAVAAFEATINSQNVPFDNYMNGDPNALSEQQLRGMELFTSKAGCLQCHGGPLFTDESFHNTGVPMNPVFEADPLRQIALRYQHMSRGVTEEVYRSADRDLGLYYTTKEDDDRGRFRTPPLREVGQTGPYMHNGAFGTLEEVVEFYNQGGGDDPNKSHLLRPLRLSDDEVADLVAFLEGLTGDQIIVEPPGMPEYAVMP